MLSVEHATVRIANRPVVDGVDLAVGPGEIVAVLGPSGCGKTTLLRAIAGLQPLDSGRVAWDGRDLADVAAHERRFGLMFQEYALFPNRDVRGNVAFGLRMAGVGGADRDRRVDAVVALVGLDGFGDRRVDTLSGGEQQRVALARALAVEPRLLMLDEPLGALDRVWRTRLTAEIGALLHRTQLPAVYVTHDHGDAFAIATRIVVMREGRLVQHGAPNDVWERPADPWVASFLGFADAVESVAGPDGVQTPWGALPITAVSGAVDVVLRPDAARLVAESEATVAGVVARVEFAGAQCIVHVEPERGPAIAVSVPVRMRPALGERVGVAIDAGAVLVFPRG